MVTGSGRSLGCEGTPEDGEPVILINLSHVNVDNNLSSEGEFGSAGQNSRKLYQPEYFEKLKKLRKSLRNYISLYEITVLFIMFMRLW